MKSDQKLSNSYLVYGFVLFSMLIYMFGFFAVIQFITEASQKNFFEAFSENPISISVGIICLILAAPTYRLNKSLRIVHLETHQNGLVILTLSSPLFMSDIPQADRTINIKNLEQLQQKDYFNRLVKLTFEENGVEQSFHSFVSPRLVARIKST